MRDRASQILTKARLLLNGEDTFTQTQAQPLLAALIIYPARNR